MQLGNSDSGCTTAAISFRGHDLVVESSHSHTEAFPCVEVVCSSDSPTGSVGGTNRPVLLKGRCALNGRCIGTSRLVDLVGTPITGDGAFVCKAGARVVCAEVLGDIVLNQRVGGPTVDREVTVTAWLIVG